MMKDIMNGRSYIVPSRVVQMAILLLFCMLFLKSDHISCLKNEV